MLMAEDNAPAYPFIDVAYASSLKSRNLGMAVAARIATIKMVHTNSINVKPAIFLLSLAPRCAE